MEHQARSVRPFIGAKDFEVSRNFYIDLGFIESVISPDMSLFMTGKMGFYLQNYYAKEWIDNTMVFLEVEDVEAFWKELVAIDLSKYESARIVPIKTLIWGKECFVHDPSGVLWHFGEFFQPKTI